MKIKYLEKPPEPVLLFKELKTGETFNLINDTLPLMKTCTQCAGEFTNNCVVLTTGGTDFLYPYTPVQKLETILEIIK